MLHVYAIYEGLSKSVNVTYLYIYNRSFSKQSLIGQRSDAVMGMPGCQLDRLMLQWGSDVCCLLWASTTLHGWHTRMAWSAMLACLDKRDGWVYIDIITAFVNVQEFLDACKIEKFWLLLQQLFSHVRGKSPPMDVFLQIWKQIVVTWRQARRIWWMAYFFKSRFIVWPVSWCIVMRK